MKIRHTLLVTAICPVDDLPDVYETSVETGRVINVETILEVAASFSERKIYQEDLTQEMARRLAATVSTVGYHSGVRTEVTV